MEFLGKKVKTSISLICESDGKKDAHLHPFTNNHNYNASKRQPEYQICNMPDRTIIFDEGGDIQVISSFTTLRPGQFLVHDNSAETQNTPNSDSTPACITVYYPPDFSAVSLLGKNIDHSDNETIWTTDANNNKYVFVKSTGKQHKIPDGHLMTIINHENFIGYKNLSPDNRDIHCLITGKKLISVTVNSRKSFAGNLMLITDIQNGTCYAKLYQIRREVKQNSEIKCMECGNLFKKMDYVLSCGHKNICTKCANIELNTKDSAGNRGEYICHLCGKCVDIIKIV